MQSQALKTDPLTIFEALRELVGAGRRIFLAGALYPVEDVVAGGVGSKSNLAEMRMNGEGPAYIKLKGRVLYRGEDLIEWLESQRVEPRGKARARREKTRVGRGND